MSRQSKIESLRKEIEDSRIPLAVREKKREQLKYMERELTAEQQPLHYIRFENVNGWFRRIYGVRVMEGFFIPIIAIHDDRSYSEGLVELERERSSKLERYSADWFEEIYAPVTEMDIQNCYLKIFK